MTATATAPVVKIPTTYDDVLIAADAYFGAAGGDRKIIAQIRRDLENEIANYARAWADQQTKTKDEALKAARLLCANLENGGQGHMSLVMNFQKFDDAVE